MTNPTGMQETFITKIEVQEVRGIQDFTIPLSEQERKHLIITGKNGSGKTSLLEAMKGFLDLVIEEQMLGGLIVQTQTVRAAFSNALSDKADEQILKNLSDRLKERFMPFTEETGLFIQFSGLESLFENYIKGNALLAYFGAKRIAEQQIPTGISKIDFEGRYKMSDRIGPAFIQHLVNLQAEKSFANEDGDTAAAQRIDQWFANFENRLRDIFQAPELRLQFDRKNYNFNIHENGSAPYTFATLPDGYSAIMSVLSELILRMQTHGGDALDMEGIVLIDEIETHLHIELQKKILPFLTDFFPKIQFIVTTHSPFVISSVSNAVVCDLEKRIVTEDLSGYSYEAIVESYFDSDQYSQRLKEKLRRYEHLVLNGKLSAPETSELSDLQHYFDRVPLVFAPELEVKLQQIKLRRLTHKMH